MGARQALQQLFLLELVAMYCLCVVVVVSQTHQPQSQQLLRARAQCYHSERLSQRERNQLDRMDFVNRSYVRRYLHCFWTRLRLWANESGFDALHIINSFGGPQRLNADQAITVINGCNASTRQTAFRNVQFAQNWCYAAFVCVLRTPVGDWYRRHMSDVINGNA